VRLTQVAACLNEFFAALGDFRPRHRQFRRRHRAQVDALLRLVELLLRQFE
jgi:hypothetical protein